MQNQAYTALRDDCLDTRQFDAFLTQYQTIRENQAVDVLDAEMRLANPQYILRNHMAQKAIELAQQDDFSEVERLFQLLSQPYRKQTELEQAEDLVPPPSDVPEVMVSCSS